MDFDLIMRAIKKNEQFETYSIFFHQCLIPFSALKPFFPSFLDFLGELDVEHFMLVIKEQLKAHMLSELVNSMAIAGMLLYICMWVCVCVCVCTHAHMDVLCKTYECVTHMIASHMTYECVLSHV
mmetsp:Transcript_73018/g.118472  ORF Transcript_73018/g.118472 Transcript_73018/m.118472 type:complete len:125 (-) Transcript_73018:130-504(-)